MSSHADPETEENTLPPASTDVDPAVDPVAEEPEPLMPEPVEDALT